MDVHDYYYGKNVLITGGGGFIGSNLAKKLVKIGARVRIMDSKLSGHGFNDFNLFPLRGLVYFDASDIRDMNAVRRNVAHQDVVFNLAAQVGEKNSVLNPELDRSINIDGHCNVLTAALEENPLAHIVFTGSRLQYGKIEGPLPVSEERPLKPLTPYARNKVLGERMYLAAHTENGLSTRMVRIANPYGPGASIKNPGYCIANWFVGRAICGLDLPIYGDGAQLRDYLFIDDLVDALLLTGSKDSAAGQIFNIGSGVGTPLVKMARDVVKLSGATGSKIDFVDWPTDAKEKETGDFVADIAKIKRILGWTPQYGLREGLRKTVEFYKKNRKYYV